MIVKAKSLKLMKAQVLSDTIFTIFDIGRHSLESSSRSDLCMSVGHSGAIGLSAAIEASQGAPSALLN